VTLWGGGGGGATGARAEGGSSRGEGGKAGATSGVGEKRKGPALLTDEEKLILVKAKVSEGQVALAFGP